MIADLLAFFASLDDRLAALAQGSPAMFFGVVTLIIFAETGFVVTPLLPGDSLLFVVGAMCGVGLMSYPLSVGLLLAAAVMGNQSNYALGRYFGPRVFQWENSKFFNKAAFNRAHDFYERYGGITIVAARFMPFVRTFAPFVAGVAKMNRAKFTFFDVAGGALWVVGIITVGYFFGNFPFVKAHLDKIIWAMILIPGLVIMLGALKSRRPV